MFAYGCFQTTLRKSNGENLLREASKKDQMLSNGEELASEIGGKQPNSTKSRDLSTIERLRTSDICIARNLRPYIDAWS